MKERYCINILNGLYSLAKEENGMFSIYTSFYGGSGELTREQVDTLIEALKELISHERN